MLQAKVTDSIPHEIIDFLSIYLILPSALWTARGLTQPLTEMRTRNLPGEAVESGAGA
jgi:hypothetical protein